jgi:hypothetical protein
MIALANDRRGIVRPNAVKLDRRGPGTEPKRSDTQRLTEVSAAVQRGVASGTVASRPTYTPVILFGCLPKTR